jgi:hypothetical protein
MTLFLSNKSRTLPVENRKNIAAIALSPDGNVLVSVDEGSSGYLNLANTEHFAQMAEHCS